MTDVTGQREDGDPRVARALKQLGIPYEIDSDGDFQFKFSFDDGRTQVGGIKSETYEFGGLEMRMVYSVGLRTEQPLTGPAANLLLLENSRVPFGAWSIAPPHGPNHVAIFSARISADLVGNQLSAVIALVVTNADEIERRLSGRNVF